MNPANVEAQKRGVPGKSIFIQDQEIPWPPRVGEPYPDLKLMDQTGQEVQLSSFKGSVILISPIGMSSSGSQAWCGAHHFEAFQGGSPQQELKSIEEYFTDYNPGLSLDEMDIVHIHLILYNMTMGPPSLPEIQAWAEHFQRDRSKNQIVLAGTQALINSFTYKMIPGYQLIDQNFILRSDAGGLEAPDNLYLHLLPLIPQLARQKQGQEEGQQARENSHYFDSSLKLGVYTSEGGYRCLGETPTVNRQGILIPQGILWYVQVYDASPNSLKQLREAVLKYNIPGLHFARFTQYPQSHLTDAGLAQLGTLPGLKYLYIHSDQVTNLGLAALKGFENLTILYLHLIQKMSDEGMTPLNSLKQLQQLFLPNGVLGPGLVHLQKCSQLSTLYLGRNLNEEALSTISSLDSLRFLGLENSSVGDLGLRHLQNLKNLQDLRLSQTQITNEGLIYLAKLDSLQRLDLKGTQITGDALEVFSGLTHLERLDLENTLIQDSDLGYLSLLPNLKRLNLRYCSNLTNKGVQALSPTLSLEWL
ncbi:MAG: hypothetical protein AABZ60_02910, partial [Planctomycetota bacterium]